ncbi:hypothetical protein Anacy_6042 (plasmid) [Anabaena cylindrica PCC 7122]|uniref:Uncharacterized protein n=1 Tax=Anabaena cylindrica (strain ATCC 27899 / PCC 7122) TaxID=272123 RepID=K9ZRC4_ANACC|nr:hypothetical protein Anacy_6042 [Anabaena cylindrica PCC 7122]BAY06351.1 hypothetical protein NIES19_56340 [Anabaena cylindrica PCC 7122]
MIRLIKSFIQIMLSGLVTAIFLNYLITEFVDIVYNINSALIWLHKSGIGAYVSKMFGGR